MRDAHIFRGNKKKPTINKKDLEKLQMCCLVGEGMRTFWTRLYLACAWSAKAEREREREMMRERERERRREGEKERKREGERA